MRRVLFAQTADPPILLPMDGEVVTLLSLDIPACYKRNFFKIDAFFELNFLVGSDVGSESTLKQNVPFMIDLNYQLFDGIGDECIALTPNLAETISGTAVLESENGGEQFIDFESNTTPNLTIIANGLENETLNLVANLNNIQGGVLAPFVNFRSINVSIFPSGIVCL
ncbi:hypothetical protein [Chengkuizengella sediminis]|uniref:hypothetical protein n=1 Tax=Chengkuizengella sediminis TaxID=1885917 RepID=UPI00138A0E54|nr:hypothetical protein [Chengkuizengella sediminis]NDI35638.1 hypothetical protein [Chengkuizengella sediminis]